MIFLIVFVKITTLMLIGVKILSGILSAKWFLVFSLFVTYDNFRLGIRRPSFDVTWFLG